MRYLFETICKSPKINHAVHISHPCTLKNLEVCSSAKVLDVVIIPVYSISIVKLPALVPWKVRAEVVVIYA
jgi:hypothetical protein